MVGTPYRIRTGVTGCKRRRGRRMARGGPELSLARSGPAIRRIGLMRLLRASNNVQIEPPLPNKIRRARSISGPAFLFGNEQCIEPANKAGSAAGAATHASRSAPRQHVPRSGKAVNPAPAIKKPKAWPCAGFFVPAIHSFDVRYAPESGP